MTKRDKFLWGGGSVLWLINTYIGLKLIGAPMDDVMELVTTLVVSLVFAGTVFVTSYILLVWWGSRDV